MEMKIIIETWNDEWHYEIEDKDDGEIVKSGYCETYTACAAECLDFVAENKNDAEQSVEQTGLCPECEAPNFDVNSACLQCGYH